jgi:hypothetical protein
MTQRSEGKEAVLRSTPALLMSESAAEFTSLHTAIELEIEPKGIIEQVYVDDIATIIWEIRRLRRCKTSIINNASRVALQCLLRELMWSPEHPRHHAEADALAIEWFSNQQAKNEVAAIFRRFHLDESAIEAEAIRRLSTELEVLDRMLTSLESRRDRAIRSIADYQDRFAKRVREVSNRIIEGDPVVRLENRRHRVRLDHGNRSAD